MKRKTGAFTLIELLVVISIIALLIAILLPALGQARKSAQFTQCMTQLRSFSIASVNYSTENNDKALLPNWAPPSAGWLYDEKSSSGQYTRPGNVGNNEQRAQMRESGWVWQYLNEEDEIYHCPVDEGPYEERSRPIHAMTSYLANGALNGFGRRGEDQYKLSDFRPDAAIFWENDEKAGLGSWHDGANDGRQSLTTRHVDGAPVSLIDGSTTKWTKDYYDSLYREVKPNSLWCNPGHSRGR